jgi:MFS family permease
MPAPDDVSPRPIGTARPSGTALGPRLAAGLVFASSFSVLVLEILAGRLLAPLVGVSLETFTGIIGTVLAGIAVGNALGGRLADRTDPSALLGPTILLGGLLSWLAPVMTSVLDAPSQPGPASIVILTTATFFAPAAVLSAVTPMVAKLRLDDVGETGRVVGNLSAIGTAGALVGTFLTGFVLVAAIPTRQLIFAIGLVLVAAGAVLTGQERLRARWAGLTVLIFAGIGGVALPDPCDAETAYACVELQPDTTRSDGVAVVLNGTRNSYVDLGDPTYLDFRYMRLFADVTGALPEGPLDALHLGGAGCTYPRYLAAVRPGTTGTVLEIDGGLVELSRRELGLTTSDELQVLVGDARLTIGDLGPDRFDVVVADAFSGLTIPWHLTTTQFIDTVDRVLASDGIVVANLIDGGDLDFVRAELATYHTRFEHIGLIAPPGGLPVTGARNLILMASHRPLPEPIVDPGDGVVLDGPTVETLLDGALVLDDDYAPVDQLRRAR